jgi:hypothetical protein
MVGQWDGLRLGLYHIIMLGGGCLFGASVDLAPSSRIVPTRICCAMQAWCIERLIRCLFVARVPKAGIEMRPPQKIAHQ